ncbi:hypothetical protein [Caulobacter sp. LjRoot300]|uniref:hypothetical protein n=1 Tax=Caulobacter sp. LjRoot300 TaxID=3342321 RepID=UPI003ED02D2F
MSARADKPVSPVFTRPRDVDGDAITAAFQDGASPRTAGPEGKAIAAEPSCFRAEA